MESGFGRPLLAGKWKNLAQPAVMVLDKIAQMEGLINPALIKNK